MKHTPESRAKISAAHKGKKVSAQARANMSRAAKARCAREKQRQEEAATLDNTQHTTNQENRK